MAVAFDAASESHTGTTGSTSEASFSWTHTPVGSPAGILVFTFGLFNNDFATAVTYGGVSLTAVTGGLAQDTTGEPGRTKSWFLGSSIPTGGQTVVVSRTNNSTTLYAIAFSVTAGADTEVYEDGIVLLEGDQALSEQLVDDGSPGTDSLRFAAVCSGLSDMPAAGANSTASHILDTGSRTAGACYETTAGQGSRSIGFTGASDDVAAVHLAVREAAGGGAEIELSPGSYAITGQTATLTKGWAISLDAGSFAITGQNSTLTKQWLITTEAGSYVVTGQDADLAKGYALNVDAGSLVITGQDVSFLRTYLLTTEAGSMAITGQDISLLHGYLLNAEAGSYALTGQDISLLKGWMIELDSDWPVITGQDAELTKGWLLTTEAGSYVITGQDVTLAQAEAYVKRLAVASMTSRRGSASVSTNRASGSAGVKQGSAAITTTADMEFLLEDGSGFIELEDDGFLLLSRGARRLNATVDANQGTGTIN